MAEKTLGQKFFNWLGGATGRFYNIHEDWKTAPTWLKESYKLEEGNLSGDIDTVFSGAVKGLVEGGLEYTKQCPEDAATMGRDIAVKAGIEPIHGIEFAQGFLKTAELNDCKTELATEQIRKD